MEITTVSVLPMHDERRFNDAEATFAPVDQEMASAMYAINRAMWSLDDEYVNETLLFIREQIVKLRLHIDPRLDL